MIPADCIYIQGEQVWLRTGGNTPWTMINKYGDIKKISVSSSTVILQFELGFELEIPKEECWIGYEVDLT